MAYSIQRKVEDAIEAAIRSVAEDYVSGITLFKGFSFLEKTTPRIEIVAAKAEPQIVGSAETGNWTVDLSIKVITHKNDATRDQHGRRAEAIGEMILRSDMVALLNGSQVEDFSAQEFTPGTAQDSSDGNEAVSEYNAAVFCANIAPEVQ